MIMSLKPNQIFVFGTNKLGLHGGGAAYQAHRDFGALYGVAEGPTGGQTYGIVTLDKDMKKVPLSYIEKQAERLALVAMANPDYEFLLTPVGTGIAGYSVEDIAPLFQGMPENIILPSEFSTMHA
jgi:hypothetical protein